MATLGEIKKALAEAKARYLEVANGLPGPAREASEEVKRLRGALIDAIVAGAEPCPHCGQLPHGMEQPGSRGSMEYQIGCLSKGCGAFVHVDGTVREHFVRGGLLPRHAAEAWNAGPDFWAISKKTREELKR